MRNLEAKFRLDDLAQARMRAEKIGFSSSAEFTQHDTFFAVKSGKLKLRVQTDGSWLIHYHRNRERTLELSNYEIVAVADGATMRDLLSSALGIIAEVRKHRKLLRRRSVRLHLDTVEGLGNFGEIEAVLTNNDHPMDYQAEVHEILAALRIPPDQLIEVSYFELIQGDC